jgi:hypothetical protein
MNYLAKIEITAIHFKGGGPAAIANLAGEVGINWPNVVKHVQSELDKWRRVIKERGMRAE